MSIESKRVTHSFAPNRFTAAIQVRISRRSVKPHHRCIVRFLANGDAEISANSNRRAYFKTPRQVNLLTRRDNGEEYHIADPPDAPDIAGEYNAMLLFAHTTSSALHARHRRM